MKPRFSLITPIYNVEPYLTQCIESMVGQTYHNIEIILVDDGSFDSCPQICDHYAEMDNRVKVIHKQNQGLVSARQVGLNSANGEYIIAVDGDDWISPDFCERMNAIIEQYHPDIVCCGYYEAYENKNIERSLAVRKGYYNKQNLKEEIYPILLQDKAAHSFCLSIWAKTTKTKLLQQEQLMDVVVNIGEDIATMAPCVFHAESMYIMDECLYYYRQNQMSITKGKKVFAWDGPEIRGRHLEKHIDMGEGDFQQQVYRSVVHSLFTVVKSQFNRKEGYKKIRKDIIANLNNSYYKAAIKNARFIGLKANLMHFSLRYKLITLIWIFNKL